MTDTPHHDRGAIVTYLGKDERGHGSFQQAVIAGAGVIDPDTEVAWLAIACPDGELTLLDPLWVVTTVASQGAPHPNASAGPIGVLAKALRVLAQSFAGLDERLPAALATAQDLVADFVRVLSPVEDALDLLVGEEPDGVLATVLSCVGAAGEELGHGNVLDGKVGILIANTTMERLLAAKPNEPSGQS